MSYNTSETKKSVASVKSEAVLNPSNKQNRNKVL